MSRNSVFLALLLLTLISAAQAQQGHTMPGMTMSMPAKPAMSPTKKLPAAPVKVSGAFVQALPPGTADGSVYLSITNTGKTALRLTGGTSNVSSSVMPMEQTKMPALPGSSSMAGMTGMKDLPAMTIAAGQTLTLSPGGDHLMLYRMKRVPQVGETISLKLNFTGYAPITLKVPVKRL